MKTIINAVVLILAFGMLFACGKSNIGSDIGETTAGQIDISKIEENSAVQSDTTNDGETSAAGEFGVFSSVDPDGNAVTGDVLTGYKLTMINIWSTTCPYCIDEMPDLAKLNSDYADKGFQVVGIISDVAAENGSIGKKDAETVKSIIDATGADYINMLVTEDIDNMFLRDVNAVPTTIFLDENGDQVGKTYLGARSYDIWAEVIESLLQEVS